MKILAIIPARGGSKQIKNKNIVEVAGRPLLYYTAAPALELLRENIISEMIVSTDSDAIAEIGRQLGVNVPFLRPEKLASDTAPSIGYALHAIDFFEREGKTFEAVLVLQPTSPLRTFQDIKKAIQLFCSHCSDSLISAYRDETINELIMYRTKDNLAIPLNDKHNQGIRRQDHGSIYIRNGAIYLVRTEFLKKTEKLISDRPLLYEMPKSRSINVDTHEDLKFVTKLLCK